MAEQILSRLGGLHGIMPCWTLGHSPPGCIVPAKAAVPAREASHEIFTGRPLCALEPFKVPKRQARQSLTKKRFLEVMCEANCLHYKPRFNQQGFVSQLIPGLLPSAE